MVEVFINNEKLDVQDAKITYVKQVNDFADLTNLKTSYTHSMRIPANETNIRIVNAITHTRNVCDIVENGSYIVKKGYGIVNEINDDFIRISFQDGIVDFATLIENKTIGNDLDLSEYKHVKTAENIIDTFNNTQGYKYLIADYGGRTYQFGNELDPDYQIPSINVQTIIDRIKNATGYSFTGMPDLSNSWMTFPTPPKMSDETTTSVLTDGLATPGVYTDFSPNFYLSWGFNFIDFQYIVYDQGEFRFNRAETYEIKAELKNSAVLYSFENSNIFSYFERLALPNLGILMAIPLKIYMIDPQGRVLGSLISDENPIEITLTREAGFYFRFIVFTPTKEELFRMLEEQEYPQWSWERYWNAIQQNNYEKVQFTIDEFTLNVLRTSEQTYDFTESLKDLTILSFLKEIMFRKSLTAFIDVEKKQIDFKTLDERTDITNSRNFPGIFKKIKSKKFTIGNFAKVNTLENQKDDEDISEDGILIVGNDNLKEYHNLFKSIFYHPQIDTASGFLFAKVWDKEVKETTSGVEITYKALSNRFYIFEEEWIDENITIGNQTVNGFPIARIGNNSLPMVVAEYYSSWGYLFNEPEILEIEIALNSFEVSQLELDRPIYIKDSFYICNKLIYESGKISTGEFIKIKK